MKEIYIMDTVLQFTSQHQAKQTFPPIFFFFFKFRERMHSLILLLTSLFWSFVFWGKQLGSMKEALASGLKPKIESAAWDMSFNHSGLVRFSIEQRSTCLPTIIEQRLYARSPSRS